MHIQAEADEVQFLIDAYIGQTSDIVQVWAWNGATDVELAIVVEADGLLRLENNATVFDDVRVPLAGARVGPIKVPGFEKFRDNGAGSDGVFAWAFSPILDEGLHFTIELPHTYKLGSDIFPHIHISQQTGGAGNADFEWECTGANEDAVFGLTSVIAANKAITAVAYFHELVEFPTIDGTGIETSAVFPCRVARLGQTGGNDTFGADIFIFLADVHFEIDTMGTRSPEHDDK